MNQIEPKVITDLEIFDKVFPAIDHTVTIYGSSKLKELIQTMYVHPALLKRRRSILENIIFHPKNKIGITKQLRRLKKTEQDVSWFFSDNSVEYDDLCFSRDWMNNKDLLTGKNFLKIYLPSILILVYLLIYLVLRYYGIKLSITEYFKGLYYSYKTFIMGILSLLLGFGGLTSFLTNMLSTLYVLYQAYAVYNSTETSIGHYHKCSQFRSHFVNLKKTVDCVKKIFKQDQFLQNEKSMISPLLNELDDLFSPAKTKSLGYSILLKKQSLEHESVFNGVLQYVGLIDALISISKLVTQDGYVFPTFDFEHTKPYVDILGVRCPYISPAIQVSNDCHLGAPNNIIITGPNTSGKSTYIRNVMIATLTAQTLGVCCCSEIVFTPFHSLFTYIDIPNVSRERESLFEAEVMRCLQLCQILENIPENIFTLTVIDELFTGTNPKEGIAGSYAVCDYIGQFSNSLSMITTHFTPLTELEIEQPERFKNYKFSLDRDPEGKFTRNYKIASGVSNQHVAIELLYQKGYNAKIIEKALDYLDRIEKPKIDPKNL